MLKFFLQNPRNLTNKLSQDVLNYTVSIVETVIGVPVNIACTMNSTCWTDLTSYYDEASNSSVEVRVAATNIFGNGPSKDCQLPPNRSISKLSDTVCKSKSGRSNSLYTTSANTLWIVKSHTHSLVLAVFTVSCKNCGGFVYSHIIQLAPESSSDVHCYGLCPGCQCESPLKLGVRFNHPQCLQGGARWHTVDYYTIRYSTSCT